MGKTHFLKNIFTRYTFRTIKRLENWKEIIVVKCFIKLVFTQKNCMFGLCGMRITQYVFIKMIFFKYEILFS